MVDLDELDQAVDAHRRGGELLSTTYASTVRNRTYTRTFDWAQAQEMHAGGMSQAAIARELGVSAQAVHAAVHQEARVARHETSLAWQRAGRCPDCGAPATRNGGTRQHRCQKCARVRISEATTTTARPDVLRCSACGGWKPDDAFSPSGRRHPGRRYRSGECKDCTNARRRAARAAA